MKATRLTSVFLPAPEGEVRACLSRLRSGEVPAMVRATEPEARRKLEEGAMCLIPAQGGCVLVTKHMRASLERAIQELAPSE